MRNCNLDDLAPVAKVAFKGLDASLRRDTPFRLFEAYRSPADQAAAVERGVSKAPPFLSAHQAGLACDFVPFIDNRWTWDVPDALWDVLAARAREFGLVTPIPWDRPHVQHPNWTAIVHLLKAPKVPT